MSENPNKGHESDNPHKKHRQRMKQRYREHGLDNFHDVNVIEFLLMFAIPQKDVNPLAHRIYSHFDESLDAVFEASVEELIEIDGVGEHTAMLISLVLQMNKRYFAAKSKNQKTVKNTSEAGQFFVPRFMHEQVEVTLMLCLDSMCRVICCKEVSRGVANMTELNVRKMVEIAFSYNAVSVILAHNHPDGHAYPSVEDRLTTAKIAKTLSEVSIELTDHIIVAGDDYVSMADSGMIGRRSKL